MVLTTHWPFPSLTCPPRHPWGGTLQTPNIGGQRSPSAGLPGLTPHSELRVGITRFQPQLLGATFPLDLAGFRPHPQGCAPTRGSSPPTHLPFPLLCDLKILGSRVAVSNQTASSSEGASPPSPCPALPTSPRHGSHLPWLPVGTHCPRSSLRAMGHGGRPGSQSSGQLLTHK